MSGLLVTIASLTKTDERIEISYGAWTRACQRNYVLGGVRTPSEMDTFVGNGVVLGHVQICSRISFPTVRSLPLPFLLQD